MIFESFNHQIVRKNHICSHHTHTACKGTLAVVVKWNRMDVNNTVGIGAYFIVKKYLGVGLLLVRFRHSDVLDL